MHLSICFFFILFYFKIHIQCNGFVYTQFIHKMYPCEAFKQSCKRKCNFYIIMIIIIIYIMIINLIFMFALRVLNAL